MLYSSTVEPGTLDVLKKLMSLPGLNSFYLVGGTALALRFGHRKSVDIDLFSINDFDNSTIIKVIEKEFPDFTYRGDDNPIGIFGFIDSLKIDLIKHHYFSLIQQPIIKEGIRMYSDQDIIAMKIMAILKRAQKKDFWDMAELLNYYPLKTCIEFYQKKYPNNQIPISIPYALSYFTDADESEDPVSLKGQTWESVKQAINWHVSEYLK
ncbi:MAG: nucleotidyl transferase AbiEii/AbiGii toxin family protein [Cyclobacteriaceae bacterium]|nr:nucleotidyl transferase AbiEii/AbiGii toxin family protein [Cyclobacteriaceae bacterium]